MGESSNYHVIPFPRWQAISRKRQANSGRIDASHNKQRVSKQLADYGRAELLRISRHSLDRPIHCEETGMFRSSSFILRELAHYYARFITCKAAGANRNWFIPER
jgi:hypothetical protein